MSGVVAIVLAYITRHDSVRGFFTNEHFKLYIFFCSNDSQYAYVIYIFALLSESSISIKYYVYNYAILRNIWTSGSELNWLFVSTRNLL